MPPGCLGYVEACEEIAAAQRAHSVTFDAIVHAVGSGGTTAGLELGVRVAGLSADPVGIPVCDDAAWFRPRIAKLCADTADRYDLGVTVDPDDIALLDGHGGPGYGLTTEPQLRDLVAAARDDGLVLDPVYTSKAWHGLRQEIAAGRFAGQTVLFLHTGGVYGMFPHAEALAKVTG
jgi:D-cysteine desulfhydrase